MAKNPLREVASWASEPPRAEGAAHANGTGFNLESYIARHLVVRRGPLPWDTRGRKWELEACPFNPEHTGGCAIVTEGNNGAIGFKCQHNSCADKHWRDVRELFDGPRRDNKPAEAPTWGAASGDGRGIGVLNGEGTANASDWAEPVPFRRHDTPTLRADLLPGFLGDMAGATACATETPPELAALLGLAVVAASVARKVIFCPEAGYIEPVNIYTAVAMESGNRKTAVLGKMARPFTDWETSEARRLKPEISRIASERKTQEARIESLRKEAAKSANDTELMARVAEMELSLPVLPNARRLWTQDVTPEQLGVLMAEQDERIALQSDEGGIFDVLAGRYSKGIPNLDLFLQAHAGAPVRVDRGSRPPVLLQNPALTVAISPQPDVQQSLSDKPGFRGRGLIARFLYGLPASPIGFRHLKPAPCPSAVERAYGDGIERLLKLAPPTDEAGHWQPWRLRFSPQAYDAWKVFQRAIEISMREGGKLYYLKDWGSKLPGAAARIAGARFIAWWWTPLKTQSSARTP